LLEYEIEIASLESFNKTKNPILSELEFVSCLLKAVTQYHLDSLKEGGLLESIIDCEDGEIKYRLTDAGLLTANLIKATCN
jgi:hypothetical protein